MKDGIIKVMAAAPAIKVADVNHNTDIIIEKIKYASEEKVKVLVFPELSITGVTCGDLHFHKAMLLSVRKNLIKIVKATEKTDMLVFVGLPLMVDDSVYNCAAVISSGKILGFVPKENVKESRFCSSSEVLHVVLEDGYEADLNNNLIFAHKLVPELRVSAMLGQDIYGIASPGARHALAGATVIACLADFPQTATSSDRAVTAMQVDSRRMSCGMILAATPYGESTTDHSYSGLTLVGEAGHILAIEEGKDSESLIEIDVDYIRNIRLGNEEFRVVEKDHTVIFWGEELIETSITRLYSKYPCFPIEKIKHRTFVKRVMDIQVSGLVKRMEYAGLDHCLIGASGGSDSTYTILVCAEAMDRMGLPRTNVIAVNMPCFGTSSRTKNNAIEVAKHSGCTVKTIDIRESVLVHFKEIEHDENDYSVAYENAQSRQRTMVLLDMANKVNGLMVGTEDLSEYIDGWCTFSGDQLSNYDINVGVPKTLVCAAIKNIAENSDDPELKKALFDVLDCPITPELLPLVDDIIVQKSEDTVGPYYLQDFFTDKILVKGFTPSKTFRLANIAYKNDKFLDTPTIYKWLRSWCIRLSTQQFKRGCLMDGPSVLDFNISPRDGLRLPSDSEYSLLVSELDEMWEKIKDQYPDADTIETH